MSSATMMQTITRINSWKLMTFYKSKKSKSHTSHTTLITKFNSVTKVDISMKVSRYQTNMDNTE